LLALLLADDANVQVNWNVRVVRGGSVFAGILMKTVKTDFFVDIGSRPTGENTRDPISFTDHTAVHGE
jgi:hypothetical protein